MKTYTLTVTRQQALTLQVACEVLARLGIGQFRDALDHLPTREFRPEGWHEDMDTIGAILSKHTIQGVDGWRHSLGIGHEKTGDNAKDAWDLYTVIRHRLSWDAAIERGDIKPGEARKWPEMMGVNYDDPMRHGKEPLARISADAPRAAKEGAQQSAPTTQAAPAATNDCTRSHPHEAMSAECQVRAVIAEMRSKEARGAEATEHELGEMADRLTQALEAHTTQAAPAAVAGHGPVAHDEDLLEQLYWEFDAQRRRTGEERLAFKVKMRSYASEFRRRSVGKMTFAQSVSDDMMNLVDRLGSECDDIDPRAWKHLLVYAPQPAPVAQGDALDAAFEAVRHRLCELQRYSFVLDDDGVVRRVQDRGGNWIEFDDAHALFDPVVVDAACAAKEGDKP